MRVLLSFAGEKLPTLIFSLNKEELFKEITNKELDKKSKLTFSEKIELVILKFKKAQEDIKPGNENTIDIERLNYIKQLDYTTGRKFCFNYSGEPLGFVLEENCYFELEELEVSMFASFVKTIFTILFAILCLVLFKKWVLWVFSDNTQPIE
jgi:hypothetical protein